MEIRECLGVTKSGCSCLVGAVNLNEYKRGIFRGKIIFVTPVRQSHNLSKKKVALEDQSISVTVISGNYDNVSQTSCSL